MAVAIPHTRGGIAAWREQWERSWLARAFSPASNPYLVHELNLIARDRRFLIIAIITLGFMGMAFRYMGAVSNRGGLVFLQEMIPLLTIFACFVLLFYRLQRPHIRYHAENAVFLCILPRDSGELLHCQVPAVLFQPLLLFLLLLPASLLLLGLGVMSPLHLAMKLALGLLILITLAVHGVCRVPRMATMFLGFPFAFFVFTAAIASLIGSAIAVIGVMSMGSGSPGNTEATIILVCFVALVICAMPVLIWFAMMNPLLTWLVQTTPWGEALRLSDTLSFIRTPFEMMLIGMMSSGGQPGINTVALTQFARIIDSLWSIPTISSWNWAFLFGMQFLLMRDALIRGTDQFEYFRVRGYPERLKELRWMERERLRTRNQRALSAQLRPVGVSLERRLPDPGLRTAITRLVAWLIRPYAPRMAYRALTMEPDQLDAYYEQRRRTHAPAMRPSPASQSVQGDRARRPARAQSSPTATGPTAAPMLAPPTSQPTAPPPPLVPPALSEAVAAPIHLPAATGVPAIAVSPPSQSAPAAPSMHTQESDIEADDGGRPRTRPAKPQMLWLSRPLARLFTHLSRVLTSLVPAALRTNPYFMRDWRALQRVFHGEQEGQWAYSWTVLLIVNISIACFVLFLTCVVQGVILISTIAQARRNLVFGTVDPVQFQWVAEFAWIWLQWMFWSCPLVFTALPVYAWLKERKRPDWDLTLLCPQMGAGWLAGKWAFFMQLGLIGILGVLGLLLLLDPLLWLGWLVPVLTYPAGAIWEPLLVHPLSALAYALLLLGWMAWVYQTIQLGSFLVMCFPTFQSRSRSFSVAWSLVGIVVSVWILFDLAMSGGLLAILGDDQHQLRSLAISLQQVILMPLLYLFSFVGSFIAEMMPLTPWRLWNWFWGPNSGIQTSEFMIEGVQSPESVLLTLGLYWGLALLHYRLSLHLLQTRLRSLEPRTFTLIRKRLPRQAMPPAAPRPGVVV